MQNPPGWADFAKDKKLMGKNIVRQNTNKRKHKVIGTVIRVKGRTVGQVIANTYQKDIITKWILNRPFPSIASDIQALHDAERAGAEYVEFTDTMTGIVYRASIAKFWDCGKFINFGYGDQQTLGLEHFEHRRDPEFIQSQTEAQDYSKPSETGDVMPLHYVSHATVGVVWNGERQLSLFTDNTGGE